MHLYLIGAEHIVLFNILTRAMEPNPLLDQMVLALHQPYHCFLLGLLRVLLFHLHPLAKVNFLNLLLVVLKGDCLR